MLQNMGETERPQMTNCAVYENVTKYGRNRKVTDDTLTRCIPFACWVTMAADTHSQNIDTYSFSTATMVTLKRLLYVSTYITSLGTFYT